MQLSLNVSGQITVVHKIEGSGEPPPITAADLKALGDTIMSVLSEKIAAATASTDQAIARVQGDVTTLTAKVAELQALVDQGTATPADLAALDDLKTKLDALDPTSTTTLPPTPTNPPTP